MNAEVSMIEHIVLGSSRFQSHFTYRASTDILEIRCADIPDLRWFPGSFCLIFFLNTLFTRSRRMKRLITSHSIPYSIYLILQSDTSFVRLGQYIIAVDACLDQALVNMNEAEEFISLYHKVNKCFSEYLCPYPFLILPVTLYILNVQTYSINRSQV